MKKTKLFLLMLCFGLFLGFQQPQTVHAEELLQANLNSQDYSKWTTVVNDYLVNCNNGQYMLVQGTNQGIVVQYYDSSYNLTVTYSIAAELPIFGGFYEDANFYYILSGQNNPNESNNVEVYRLTKYDKTWKRLGSASLYGANTTIPFRAGSARMDNSGEKLIIRTCHEMYTSSDGLNHQANVTILVNTNTMQIMNAFTEVQHHPYGYASHSMNQFVRIDNDVTIGVDHGDAYPRSILLVKAYPANGSLQSSRLNVYPIQEANKIHYNYTGVSIGGLEFSDSNYLIAGNSVVQDANWEDRTTRNIMVIATDKETETSVTNWITNYAEGEASASTPHLVKLDDNSFMLLWYREGTLNYVKLNGKGQAVGMIYQTAGYLSECQPIVADGKLVWYVCDYSGDVFFFEIDIANPKNIKCTQAGGKSTTTEAQTTRPASTVANITGVYIPQNDGKVIRAGAIIDTQETNLTYECTVIDYDYAKYGTSPYPEVKRTTDKNDNWMEYTPGHAGMYGFCWRAYDADGNLLSEFGATQYFEGNTVSSAGIYIPDRNAQTLDFGMVFNSPDKDNVRITWFLYRPDDNVYEAILSDGLVKDNGVIQKWTKKPGRYWIMCRVTAVNNPASSICWGVEVRDGVVIDPQ